MVGISEIKYKNSMSGITNAGFTVLTCIYKPYFIEIYFYVH